MREHYVLSEHVYEWDVSLCSQPANSLAFLCRCCRAFVATDCSWRAWALLKTHQICGLAGNRVHGGVVCVGLWGATEGCVDTVYDGQMGVRLSFDAERVSVSVSIKCKLHTHLTVIYCVYSIYPITE